MAPGSLSLNLRGVLAEDAAVFHAAVSELVPKCARVPVTTESLKEKFKFAPKKVRLKYGSIISSYFASLEGGGRDGWRDGVVSDFHK